MFGFVCFYPTILVPMIIFFFFLWHVKTFWSIAKNFISLTEPFVACNCISPSMLVAKICWFIIYQAVNSPRKRSTTLVVWGVYWSSSWKFWSIILCWESNEEQFLQFFVVLTCKTLNWAVKINSVIFWSLKLLLSFVFYTTVWCFFRSWNVVIKY